MRPTMLRRARTTRTTPRAACRPARWRPAPRSAASAGRRRRADSRPWLACNDWSVPRFDVVGVIVSDLHRAVGFYGRLGIRFPQELDSMGHGHVEAVLPGGLRFTLDT